MLNFDQAGYGSGADRVHVEPDDVPANAPMVRTLFAVLSDHAPPEASEGHGAFPREWASVRSLGGTDSYVFSASPAFRERGASAGETAATLATTLPRPGAPRRCHPQR